jgi:hypothetical protein
MSAGKKQLKAARAAVVSASSRVAVPQRVGVVSVAASTKRSLALNKKRLHDEVNAVTLDDTESDDGKATTESDFDAVRVVVSQTPDASPASNDGIDFNLKKVHIEVAPVSRYSKVGKPLATRASAAVAATESADEFISARGAGAALPGKSAAASARKPTIVGDLADVVRAYPRANVQLIRVEVHFGLNDAQLGTLELTSDELHIGIDRMPKVLPLKLSYRSDVQWIIRSELHRAIFIALPSQFGQFCERLDRFGPKPGFDPNYKHDKKASTIQVLLMNEQHLKQWKEASDRFDKLREKLAAGSRVDAKAFDLLRAAKNKRQLPPPPPAKPQPQQPQTRSAYAVDGLNGGNGKAVSEAFKFHQQQQQLQPRLTSTSKLTGAGASKTVDVKSKAIDLAADDSDTSRRSSTRSEAQLAAAAERAATTTKRSRRRLAPADDDSDAAAADDDGDSDDASEVGRVMFRYPPPPNDTNAVTVTSRDLRRLRPGEYLNDVLIEFYLRYLLLERMSAEQRKRIHVFNSYFYDKISNGWKPNNDGKCYAEVARWTKNVDVFTKDLIIIPVNENAHWHLMVACFIGDLCADAPPPTAAASGDADNASQTHGQDAAPQRLPRTPCLLRLDSLGMAPGKEFMILRDYFAREFMDKRPGELTAGELQKRFSLESLVGVTVRAPEQDNVFDCGLFLLHYAEQLCMGLDELFSDEKTPPASRTALRCMFERRRPRFWFDQARITEKRKEVHKLIEFIETRTAASATTTTAAAAGADDQTQPMD